jgi:hypothetical protein
LNRIRRAPGTLRHFPEQTIVLLRQGQEARVKHLNAALICFGILYAVDAYFFGGWYLGIAKQAFAQAWSLHW